MDLNSSVKKVGKKVTYVIHYMNGTKKTIHGALTDTIEQGQFTKFFLEDGRMIMVNDINVLQIEVFEEK